MQACRYFSRTAVQQQNRSYCNIVKNKATIMFGSNRLSFTFEAKNAHTAFSADAVVLCGKKDVLLGSSFAERLAGLLAAPTSTATFPYSGVVASMLKGVKPGAAGKSTTSYVARPSSGPADGQEPFIPLSTCVLPAAVSRNNHPMSVHVITDLVAGVRPDSGNAVLYIVGATRENIGALASAIGKAMPPLYDCKTDEDCAEDGAPKKDLCMTVCFLDEQGQELYAADEEGKALLASAHAVAEGVRITQLLADKCPAELTTTAYSQVAQSVAKELGECVTFEEIVGDELLERGYGGIHGVGRAAQCPPRLIMMTYTPETRATQGSDGPVETVALVGKGIVYDAGGLSIKSTVGMCGMKHDMGGSAGLFGGFYAAVKVRVPQKVTLLLCVAENAVGPASFRNDDVLRMYSGKTVEVNNTDAEGRLVLADGVAHATKNIAGLDTVLNMCTLTGAQLITTGKKHAGILANTIEAERRIVDAGMASGDLCFPMLYAPELLKKEFKSKVADMKNSVKDRANAQSSCAGHFIESHLDPNYKGAWIHVDMAGPATKEERATGFGVGLVLSLLKAPGF